MARMAGRVRQSSPALLRGGKHPPRRNRFRVIGQNPPAWNTACGSPSWTPIAYATSKPPQDDRSQAYLPPPLPPRSPQLRAWTGSAPLPSAPAARPAALGNSISAVSSPDEESPYTEFSFQRPRQAAPWKNSSTVSSPDRESPYDELSFARSGQAVSEKKKSTSSHRGEEPIYTDLSSRPSKPVDGA
jgi:hypothetical protein